MKLEQKDADRGSVLVFGVGLAIVILLVLTTAINIASLWVTRTKLDSVADATALAASRSIDFENLYRVGISQPIKLSESLARSRASWYLGQLAGQTQLTNFRLVSLAINNNSVEVVISADADYPFGYLSYGFDSTVFSRAKVSIKTK